VHTERNDLHGPLLHLLHSIVYAASASAREPRERRKLEEEVNQDDATLAQRSIMSPLLLQTLDDGLRRTYMGPNFHRWLDFLLLTVPLFRPPNAYYLLTLIDRLGWQIRSAVNELTTSWPINGDTNIERFTVNELDLMALLNALEKLTIFISSWHYRLEQNDSNSLIYERAANTNDSGGLLGIVSSVFNTEGLPKSGESQNSVGVYRIIFI
jgi:hypothetical protein